MFAIGSAAQAKAADASAISQTNPSGNLAKPQPQSLGTDITADHITRDANGVLVATGNVIIKRKDQTLYADRVRYDVQNHWIQADGHVYHHLPERRH